jgi:hypothetical protein
MQNLDASALAEQKKTYDRAIHKEYFPEVQSGRIRAAIDLFLNFRHLFAFKPTAQMQRHGAAVRQSLDSEHSSLPFRSPGPAILTMRRHW